MPDRNPYRSAAQGRLLAILAPSLTDQEAALAAADLLDLLYAHGI